MNYANFSISTIKESILHCFAINKTLSATITKWMADNTANAAVKNSPFMLLTSVDNENNFVAANE